jgi:hypothetical protein
MSQELTPVNESQEHPTCPDDGFPLIDIQGAATCSAEHADSAIGGHRIVSSTVRDGYLYLEFDNQASIPLTCPCCGGRLHLRSLDPDQLGQMLVGRTAEGFRHGEWVSNDGSGHRHPIFAIQFSGEEDVNARTLQVHLDSVRSIEESRR